MVMRLAGSAPGLGIGLAPGARLRKRSFWRRNVLSLLVALVGAAGPIGLPDRAAAQAEGPIEGELGVEETENLVRRVHYEGLPEEEAARIGVAGAARLVEMLADPEEKASHGRILVALGIAGRPGAYEAMMAWVAAQPPTGEIDRDRFRAWQVLPFALGRLATRDPRAVDRLAACFDAPPPGWSFRQFQGARLQTLERRSAAGALAETGLPEARRVLDVVERRSADPALAAHVRAVRAEAAARSTGAAQ
jgi:hypothetical protein